MSCERRYWIRCYIRADEDPNCGEQLTMEEARGELCNLELMQPENIYRLVEFRDDEEWRQVEPTLIEVAKSHARELRELADEFETGATNADALRILANELDKAREEEERVH